VVSIGGFEGAMMRISYTAILWLLVSVPLVDAAADDRRLTEEWAFQENNSPESDSLMPAGASGNISFEASGGAPLGASVEPAAWAFPGRTSSDYVRRHSSLLEELTFFAGIDGSKQPQDFGVNAVVGGQVSMNWGLPLLPQYGVGMQVGTGLTATANAVRVFELVGETTGRTQSFTTLGIFQRLDNGISWGFAHDFLYEEYFDNFSLSQWRIRGAYDLGACNQVGVNAMLPGRSETGVFGASTNVQLKPIAQANVFWRHYWESGPQTTMWIGVAEGHGENNAVVGPAPAKGEQFLFGGDFLAPLTDSLAIYGESNLIMPADTGTVDAFLGVQWYPGRRATSARRGRFNPLLPLASPTTFAVDLVQ
jgi:hypothetical protein